MIEGMTLAFNPEAAADMEADIQFQVSGSESGSYYLNISERDCKFNLGDSDSPSLIIKTPAETWKKISSGEISGQDALAQGLYKADGDLSILLRFGELFSEQKVSYESPPHFKPPGPVKLSGMKWLTVAFLPWMFFWIAFESLGNGLNVIIPFALSLFLVSYRFRYGVLTFFEAGSLGFFSLALIMKISNFPGFEVWGSVLGSLYIALLWLGSLFIVRMPLCGEYSKWQYIPRLWRTTLFIYPNAVISLMWGGQFLLASVLGMAAVLFPSHAGLLNTLRFLLLIPAFVFTAVYQRGVVGRMYPDIDRSLGKVRLWGGLGFIAGLCLILAAFSTA